MIYNVLTFAKFRGRCWKHIPKAECLAAPSKPGKYKCKTDNLIVSNNNKKDFLLKNFIY